MKKLKQEQLRIVRENNPALNDESTWIRNIDDIKTFEEAEKEERPHKKAADIKHEHDKIFSKENIEKILKTKKIKVHSSKPIELGTFVTPDMREAKNYAGPSGKIYQKIVDIDEIAWIDIAQGQYTGKIEKKGRQNR